MCLIHTHNVDTILSDAWIENFYDHNADGIGVMLSEPDENGVKQLVIKKFLPKTAADAVKFYHDNIKGKKCVVHWRMATHGDVDLLNCHPYEITPLNSAHPLWMMHNGVLSRGNYGDKSKSDTWHFIQDILKPMLDPAQGGNPDLAYNPGFRELVGDAIGNGNRFVFMDADGDISIVNRWTGVEWNYMWMSNTYAWDAPAGLTKKGPKGEPRDMSNDHNDVPDDWSNYRGFANKSWKDYQDSGFGTAVYPTKAGTYGQPTGTSTGVTKGNGTVVTGKVFGGGKKNKKRKSKNALVPQAAPVSSLPTGASSTQDKAKQSWFMDELDKVFEILDEEGRTKAYSNLTYTDFTNFANAHDIDTLWEATYMCVDGVISQESFIEYMKDPKKWTATSQAKARTDKVNVGTGESYPLANGFVPAEDDIDGPRSIEEQEAAYDEWLRTHVSNEEIIEATLPRQLVSADTSRFAEAAARELDQVTGR